MQRSGSTLLHEYFGIFDVHYQAAFCMKISNRQHPGRLLHALPGFIFGMLALFLSACSGDGNNAESGGSVVKYSGKSSQLEINRENIEEILYELNFAVPICGGVKGASLQSLDVTGGLDDILPKMLTGQETGGEIPVVLMDTARKFVLGSCGGLKKYQDISFSSASRNGVLQLDSLCSSIDDNTSVVMNAEIPFDIKFGFTPTGFQITSATSSSSLFTADLTGANAGILGTSRLAFSGFEYRVDGADQELGTETTESFLVDQLTLTSRSDKANKSALLTNVVIQRSRQVDGNIRENISGRIYIDTLGYMDVSTEEGNPIIVDRSGIHQSGKLVLTGSNGSRGEMTIVPRSNPTFVVRTGDIPSPIGALTCLKVTGKK